ncbi:MAG: hypothetical protein Q8784_02230 [Vigna little leaf phytoplasma]|nr:hypothetical protein [Vigna little leaf phytoplasma]
MNLRQFLVFLGLGFIIMFILWKCHYITPQSDKLSWLKSSTQETTIKK